MDPDDATATPTPRPPRSRSNGTSRSKSAARTSPRPAAARSSVLGPSVDVSSVDVSSAEGSATAVDRAVPRAPKRRATTALADPPIVVPDAPPSDDSAALPVIVPADTVPADVVSTEREVSPAPRARAPHVVPVPARHSPEPSPAAFDAPTAPVTAPPVVVPVPTLVLPALPADDTLDTEAIAAPAPPQRNPVQFRRRRPRVRRVTRVVRHVDTWSVFKVALVFNLFFCITTLVAGVLLWQVAYATGTVDNIENFFLGFGWETFELKGGEIYHNAWIVGLFLTVGLTGLAVFMGTLFNLITDLVGGIRVSVLEEEVVVRSDRSLLNRRVRAGRSTEASTQAATEPVTEPATEPTDASATPRDAGSG